MKLATLTICTGLASITAGYKIIHASGLNCRAEPNVNSKIVLTYSQNDNITVDCQTQGEKLFGTAVWDKTSDDCYVLDYYVDTGNTGYVTKKCGVAGKCNKGSGSSAGDGSEGGSNATEGTTAAAEGTTAAAEGTATATEGTTAAGESATSTDDNNDDDKSSAGGNDNNNNGSSKVPGPIKDDYPYKHNCNEVDPWLYYTCQCTSFVAWRINSRLKVSFNNHYKGPNWGNADTWANAARKTRVPINNRPVPGCVAQTDRGAMGHVAWVAKVAGSSVTIEEYNWAKLKYSTRTVPRSTFKYIHIKV
ncbi:hypothetical protein GGI25_001665 [Coemansia spiralis]|uniref:Peptidase C51 domain-containing protein n=2 Tax=Coemansia TaxID=4863 RepID=A0A9W8KZW9_9FUNG|nr:hypothetical protein EDC05_005487 [Coemansia umbellata]KAJ2623903.1 hypothetical protein GGI26_001918 [Coemansia sp. RSA 1358]KAJ2679309.1 hypothetical protein GGI25_001665 [Coemansia spiralis]